jgi:hypothetical protein
MKAAIVFTGTGPILVVTNMESLEDPKVHAKLRDKGFTKFIIREASLDQVEKRYRGRFKNIQADLAQHPQDVRVLDYNGNQVFVNFEFPDLGEAIEVEDDVVLP